MTKETSNVINAKRHQFSIRQTRVFSDKEQDSLCTSAIIYHEKNIVSVEHITDNEVTNEKLHVSLKAIDTPRITLCDSSNNISTVGGSTTEALYSDSYSSNNISTVGGATTEALYSDSSENLTKQLPSLNISPAENCHSAGCCGTDADGDTDDDAQDEQQKLKRKGKNTTKRSRRNRKKTFTSGRLNSRRISCRYPQNGHNVVTISNSNKHPLSYLRENIRKKISSSEQARKWYQRTSNTWRSIVREATRGHNRPTDSARWKSHSFLDPFQVFEVEHESCLDFQITIHRGEAITKGSVVQDYIDTPDPYIILKIPGSSNSSKRTTQLDNTTVPLWEETFHFFLDPAAEHILNVTLMDANIMLDETLGDDTFIVNTLPNDVKTKHTFVFPGGSKIHATLMITKNKSPDLRFSLALCEKEREFLQIRRQKVLLGLHKVLGDQAPDTDKQVPIVAVLGSGGGFRAMICLSGVVRALHQSGLLDCATYISGLSGSSWYISNLYSHETFPNVDFEEMRDNMRESVTSGWKWKLTNSLGYVTNMLRKYRDGQPISFTDFFGHLLGDVLLKDRKYALLTHQQRIVAQGTVPFPLYTCLHAKRSVSCRNFSEWVEFSPYEIGIAKYGTFMKTEHFGSKFMVGKLIKQHPESPLHFLQGVWGSAFTILFKRLVMQGSLNKDMVQMMRENAESTEREINEQYDDELLDQITESDTEDEDDIIGKDDITLEDSEEEDHTVKFTADTKISITCEPGQSQTTVNIRNKDTAVEDPPTRRLSDEHLSPMNKFVSKSPNTERNNNSAFNFEIDQRKISKDSTKKISNTSNTEEMKAHPEGGACMLSRKPAIKRPTTNGRQSTVSDVAPPSGLTRKGTMKFAERRKTLRAKREEKNEGFIGCLKQSLMTGTNLLNNRTGRAGEILNPFRGLSLKHSFPISPFAETIDDEEDDVDSSDIGAACRYKQLDNKAKKLFIVDSGLAFNSPYPLLLRPQRAVDMYLSFDFSMRETDATLPFKELILAEKWARQNKVPFPPIEKQGELYKNEGYIREVYVFKNEDDPFCPVILHFPLVNHNFRTFKAPGVKRETDEEIQFGDFKIFDDETNVYSSTNFMYEDIQFDRMTKLTEFNTLLCMDTIKEELAKAVKVKKDNIAKRQLGINDVAALLSKVKSVRRSAKESGLRLNVAHDKELRLMNMLRKQGGHISPDSASDPSDYSDANEYLN